MKNHLKSIGLRNLRRGHLLGMSLAVLFGGTFLLLMAGDTGAQNRELRAPAAFAGITDPQARSRALFTEAAKAIMSPRCITLCPAP